MSVQAVQAGQASASAAASAGSSYTVQRGDTLSAIAREHGVPLSQLISANPQIANPDLIFPDQQINLPAGASGGGGAGGVAGAGGIASAAGDPVSGPHANAAAVAEQYLGQNASSLRGDRSDNLPMQAGIPTNVCCANFVSAVLVEAGQLPPGQQTASVQTLKETLQSNGWTQVPASQAQRGDVVIQQGQWPGGGRASHTQIVSGPNQTIGSNNRNSDGSQRVTTGSLSGATSATNTTIWRAPAGVASNASAASTGGVAATGGPASAGAVSPGDQAGAVRYFESQGWSRDQAAGIVANLVKESNLSPTAVGDGGRAYGIAQWHPDRQANFERFTGHSIQNSTVGEQLAFVNHELRTTEAGAGNRLRGADTAAEAGAIVSRYYERPADADGAASARAQLATQIAGR